MGRLQLSSSKALEELSYPSEAQSWRRPEVSSIPAIFLSVPSSPSECCVLLGKESRVTMFST